MRYCLRMRIVSAIVGYDPWLWSKVEELGQMLKLWKSQFEIVKKEAASVEYLMDWLGWLKASVVDSVVAHLLVGLEMVDCSVAAHSLLGSLWSLLLADYAQRLGLSLRCELALCGLRVSHFVLVAVTASSSVNLARDLLP